MTPQKAGRGRPKGTGLNDAAHLRAIAGLMAENPDLRPTTAIKALGITDPSVIRRLRDKFAAANTELNAELGPKATVNAPSATAGHAARAAAHSAPDMIAAPTASAPSLQRAAALASPRSERITAPVAPSIPAQLPPLPGSVMATRSLPNAPDRILPPSETELPKWLGVGLSVYVLSVEAQFAVFGSLFQWPPYAAVLRSQTAFTDLAVALTAPVASRSHQAS